MSLVTIVPDRLSSSPSKSDLPWMYRVGPSHELPTLDLSVTLKSHYLSTAARQRFDSCMRRRRGWMLIAYAATTMMYIATLVTPPLIGDLFSIIGVLLGLPGTAFILSALRYDMVVLSLRTYDFVFFDSIVVSTLVVFMIMVHDARVLIILQALIAYQINIFIDANIQAVRRVAIVNAFAMLMSMFVGGCVMLDIIPEMKHFTLLEYGSHSLNARAFVSDGFITIVAIMLRNTYRKKALLLNRSTGSVLNCVSYRCHLTIQPFVPSPPAQTALNDPSAPVHIQKMRYVPSLPVIDARQVLIPQLFSCLMGSKACKTKRLFFQMLGTIGAVLVLGVGLYEFVELETQGGTMHDEVGVHVHFGVICGVVFTCAYTLACCTIYQRDLLREIVSSFDFIFLSSQLTFVHVATADFFRWNPFCLFLVATWLWCHWVICIDALTPIARDRIGLSPIFTKLIISALVMSTGILNHLLIFCDNTIEIHDRIIWSVTLWGRYVEFRMLSSFYSAYVTVMAWALRLLWRMLAAKRDEFVLIDGAVAYTNYLRQPTNKSRIRVSLPRLSITRDEKVIHFTAPRR